MATSARSAVTPIPGVHYRDLARTGLRGWARVFWLFPSPRIIAAVMVLTAGLRVAVGGWTRSDAIVLAVLVVSQPFVEWLLHVTVLHFKPRTVGGRTMDPYVSRKHREHHLDPEAVQLVFVQLPTLIGLYVVAFSLYAVALRDLHLTLTAMATGSLLLLIYEWTHYLIHSPYVPRGRPYRYVWRAHRLHHYKNEKYWFGITSHIADHVLRTFPEKSAVPTSPTCRTLGVGVAD
jgi:hypothetical protein